MEALMQTWSFFVDAFTPVWENLRTQPSLWLAVTLVAYAFGDRRRWRLPYRFMNSACVWRNSGFP